jgi:putative ABC transport system permease protein
MPLRFLRGHTGRLLLSIIALACGVALVCAIDLVNRAVARAFVDVVDTMAGRAALQIGTGGTGLFAEETADTVAAVPGVELAVPVVSATAFTTDGSGELLTVHGVDLTNESAVRTYETGDADPMDVEDELIFLNQPDSIAVTRTFADRRRLQLGDPLELETATGRRRFTVRGLLEPTGVARVYGGNLVVMDLFAAEAAFARPGFINRLDVVVERRAEVTRVARDIAAVLPAGLRVETPEQRRADLHRIMQSLQVMLRGMGLVGLVAAFLIAFNRLSTVFEGRGWQLGVLRAVGLRTRTVWWELLKESLLLGAAGVLVGIPAGMALGRLVLPIIATTTALNYKLVAPEVTLALDGRALALAAGLGLAAAVLAALLPAWRAARVSVTATLRGRGVELPAAGRGWLWRASIAAALAASLALQAATGRAAWGLAATACIAAATATAALPLLRLIHPFLGTALARTIGPVGRLVAGALEHNPRRVALTVAMLGVGLGSVFWLGTIARSFERSMLGIFSQAMRADLVVGSAHMAAGYLELPIDDRVGDRLGAIPGVVSVVGVRVSDWEYGGGAVAIDAFDPIFFTDPRHGQWPLYGPALPDAWGAVARGEAVVVSSNFIMNLKAEVGDLITIETPTGPLAVRIAGMTVDFASPRGTIEMSRALYERYWHDPQVTRFLVGVAPGADVAAVRTAIAATLGTAHSLRILASRELLDYFATQIRRAFTPIDVLAAMTLLVVLLGLADTLAASVTERTREIGTARALGVPRRQVHRMVLAEAAVIAGAGFALAAGAGLGLGVLWVQSTFPYLLGYVLNLHLPWERGLGVGLLVVGISLVAALPPARRAVRLDPSEALRWE